MKQTHQSVAMAGLLAVALAISGCAAMRGEASPGESSGGSSSSSGASGTSGSTGSSGTSGTSGSSGTTTESIQDGAGVSGSSETSGSSGSSGASGASGSGTSSLQDDGSGSASTAGAASAAPNSTVLAIEVLPASSGITEGDSSMGSSGAAGATGSSQSYRVTVRMDDGSTQVVTHGATPDFRSGDRVNVTSGSIQR